MAGSKKHMRPMCLGGMASWGISLAAQPGDWGNWWPHFMQYLLGQVHILPPVLGPQYKKCIYQLEWVQQKVNEIVRDWSTCPVRWCCRTKARSAWRIYKEVINNIEPGSSQRCKVGGWRQWVEVEIREVQPEHNKSPFFSFFCPEQLCSPHL